MKNLLQNTISEVLSEMDYGETYGAGGAASENQGGAFSGDIYAKGDARVPKILFGTITRNGATRGRHGKKYHKKPKK